MDLDTYREVYRVALIFAGIGSLSVPVVYAIVSEGKWRDSTLGKHLMGSDATIAAMFVFTAVALLTDSPRIELIVGSSLFILFGILRLVRSRYMLRARKVRRAQEKYGLTEGEVAE